MQIVMRIGLVTTLLTSSIVMTNAQSTKETSIPNNPKSVASFDLGVVDTLDQLQVPVKALPKQTLPKYLEKYKATSYVDVGGLKSPNIEKIKQLKPDLIVISGRQQVQYDEFSKIAPTINLGVDPKEYERSFKNNMIMLGKLFNKLPEISNELAIIDTKAQDIQKDTKKSPAKTLVTVHYKGRLMAADQTSHAGLINGWLGFKGIDLSEIKNKRNDTPRLVLDSKEIASLNPDILFVIDRGEAIGEEKLDTNKIEDRYIKQTNAYKHNKIIYLTPDLWYLSGNGLQSVSLQMDEVARALKR